MKPHLQLAEKAAWTYPFDSSLPVVRLFDAFCQTFLDPAHGEAKPL